MVKKIKKKYIIITFLLTLSSSAMIAHGLRMMTQGLFHPTSYYPAPLPSTIDFWFDWFFLFILGSIVFFIAIKQWLNWVYNPKST